MTEGTPEPGVYLCSDQGDAYESLILDRISEAKKLLTLLTFENDRSLHNERTRDTALSLCDALWRLIYYANGS